MRKRTTTRQLQQAISTNLLHITSAEKYHKNTRQTETISPETFKDSLDFVCESIFMDSIGWHFERNYKTGDYVIDCGRMNPDSDFVVIAHLRANEGVSREDIDRALMMNEEE